MRLPYSMRKKLIQGKKLRKSADRAERGIWNDDRLTQGQKNIVALAASRIRDEAEKAEKEAFGC